MKNVVWILMICLLFTGCDEASTFETISDEIIQSVMAQPREVYLELPEESAMPAMQTDSGKLYMCEDYDILLQTMESGDLEKTVRSVSGFEMSDLTFIQTASGEIDRYEFVWTSSEESGQQICRGTILDDGNYHYVLTTNISADLILEYQEIWNGLFESFKLI